MRVRVREVGFFVTECRTQLPFRFGAATVTWAPLLTARVAIETEDGRASEGFSADLMMPRWFDKDPAKSVGDNVRDLAGSARAAARKYVELPPGRVFDLWLETYRAAPDGLVEGFGLALVERAVMDATCRAVETSFFRALKDDLFGFDPGKALPALDGWSLAASLPEEPVGSVRVRHTIGLADELADLEQEIARHGLTCFKLKLSGEPRADARRLLDLAAVLDEISRRSRGVSRRSPGGAELTVDANEQYGDPVELARVLDAVSTDDAGARLLRGLLHIEQPVSRALSLEPGVEEGIAALSAFAPVILDEADIGIESFPRAIELGYRGVSVKNCKGVFRTLLNRGVCETREPGLFQSAEDLTNLPVLALQQDLATIAALGLPHAERNGHHYFPGLRHLPPGEARAALAAHPDLYAERDGEIYLRIEDGALALGSIQTIGYGYDVPIDLGDMGDTGDVAARTPLDDWECPED
ncbi:MAG: mandelate racemase [Planctomycetota bacterium]|nr:mandelate racemase [Planctomycetota bacterium]